MTVRVSWAQALAWRMRRQMLDPAVDLPDDEVVRRLGGVRAQVASTAELGVRVRQASSRPGEVGDALAGGRLIKTWAMRGTLHLTKTVRLVPGFDAWVLGPGTDDPRVVPPERRPAVSRQSGWIAPLVISGGSVSGTSDRTKDRVDVDWFGEAGPPLRAPLEAEVERLSSIVGRDLELAVRVV